MEFGFRHLQVVVAIFRHGSISSAAVHLGLSQPALSAQLTRIETALGGPLFHRSRTGVVATPLGEDVLRRSDRLLTDFRTLLDEAHAQAKGSRGLVVSANRTPYCAAFIAGVTQALPEREVVPHTSTSTTVIDDLIAGGQVDLAVVGTHPDVEPDRALGPDIRAEVVVDREPFLVAISAAHRLARLPEVPLALLGDDPWLLPPGRPDGTLAALQRAFEAAGIDPPTPLGRQRLADYGPYVAAGMAVAITLPTLAPHDGVVVRPLVGSPVVGRRVLRWDRRRVSDAEAESCAGIARAVFLDELTRVATHQQWWSESPGHRPRMSASQPVLA